MIEASADFSHHQTHIDFAAIAADGVVRLVWHKASNGAVGRDDACARRRELARSVGLEFGVYAFCTNEPAEAQAMNLLSMVQTGDLVAVDLERNPLGTTVDLQTAEGIVALVGGVTGRPPTIYGGGDYLRNVLRPRADSILGRCPLWWAQYGSAPTHLPVPWSTWTFWQHTDGNVGAPPRSLAGVGPCDRDAFNGDAAQLAAFIAANRVVHP